VNQIEYSIMIEPLNSNAKVVSLEEADATLVRLEQSRIIQVILRCVAANHVELGNAKRIFVVLGSNLKYLKFS